MFFKKEAKFREEISALKKELDSLRAIVMKSSIGNKGVKTDIRQTPTRQTPSENLDAVELVKLVGDFKDSLPGDNDGGDRTMSCVSGHG